MHLKQFLLLSVCFTFLLTSCGESVCVGGMGKCELSQEIVDQKKNPSTTSSGSRSSALKAGILLPENYYRLLMNEKITLTGVGGRPPYKFSMVSAAGTTGDINADTGVFTPPANLQADAKVKITDADNVTTEIRIDIR